jgi:hypothetical protein
MRTILLSSVSLLVLTIASPASAQMCGGGQGAGAMCGMMRTQGQATEPTPPAATPGQQPGQTQAGCACCRNMAMMRPQGGGQQGGHSMPGMEMPAQR